MPDIIGNALALFLAWLFVSAGVQKIRAPAWYTALIGEWLGRKAPSRSASPAIIVGLVESALGIAVLVPQARIAASAATAAILTAYASMMWLQIRQGRRDAECGCSGPASGLRISGQLVLRNLACASMALGLLLPPVDSGGNASAVASTVLIALFVAILYHASDRLIGNAQKLRALKAPPSTTEPA